MALKQRQILKLNPIFAYDDYSAYIRRANKHDIIIEEILSLISSHLSSTSECKKIWNMIDVGCGDGLLSVKLVEKIVLMINNARTYKEINCDMLDPSEEIINNLKKKITSIKWADNVSFYYNNQTIEEYLDRTLKSDLETKYDVIFGSHVFYHIDKWGEVIHQLLNRLKDGGWMCIVLVSDATDLYQFRDRLLPLLKDCELVENDGKYIFGRDMESFLMSEQISYKKMIKESYITFSAEDINNMDIIYQVMGFLYRFKPEDLKTRCADEIKEFILRQRDTIKNSNGNLQFLYKDEFYLIRR